jgi:hypothetical protein
VDPTIRPPDVGRASRKRRGGDNDAGANGDVAWPDGGSASARRRTRSGDEGDAGPADDGGFTTAFGVTAQLPLKHMRRSG